MTEKSTIPHRRLASVEADIDTSIITIGMATHDDFDGVYFSIMSLVLYHKELLDQIEILVIDNNPESVHGEAVRGLCRRVRQASYVPAGEYQGTAVRERVFAEAKGKVAVCMDCHVFLHAGAVASLIDHFKQNPNSKDLLHGPPFYDNHDEYSTHMRPEWNGGFFGRWDSDPRGLDINGEPFDISLQGMGLFAFLKSRWLGFNHRFRGFGGEEGCIHEKFRQNGGRVLCLPFLRWTHRFDRPNAPSYPNRWQDRIRNYLIGWHELNLDYKPVLEHFSSHLNYSQAASVQASFLPELKGRLWSYDTQYFLCDSEQQWAEAQPSLRASGIENIVQRINSIEQLEHLLTIAQANGIKNVVLIDARQQIKSLTEDINTVLDHLSRSPNDIITCRNSLATLEFDCVSIIQNRAFTAAIKCFSSHLRISDCLVQQIDDSITMVNVYTKPIEQKTNL
jgi:ribosomal protein S15P/S13E